MFRLHAVVVVLAGTLLVGGRSLGQEQKDPAPPRGTLPANFKKLGLSEDQLQEVYRIRGQFRAKMDSLRRQMADLRRQERVELDRVLTDAQRARLREIRAGETGSGNTRQGSKERTEPRPPSKEKAPDK